MFHPFGRKAKTQKNHTHLFYCHFFLTNKIHQNSQWMVAVKIAHGGVVDLALLLIFFLYSFYTAKYCILQCALSQNRIFMLVHHNI
jgi:thiamine pyrophosphokinase